MPSASQVLAQRAAALAPHHEHVLTYVVSIDQQQRIVHHGGVHIAFTAPVERAVTYSEIFCETCSETLIMSDAALIV